MAEDKNTSPAIEAQSLKGSEQQDEKARVRGSVESGSEIDLLSYHEHNAGRLVIDPECAPCSFAIAGPRLNTFPSRYAGRHGLSLGTPSRLS